MFFVLTDRLDRKLAGTRIWIVNETDAPFAKLPILHPVCTVPEVQTADVERKVTPAGRVSVTITLVALSVPLFVTVIV
jgi:hypothetical protein